MNIYQCYHICKHFLNMANSLVDIVKFKQEINESIDQYIEIIKGNKPDDNNIKRIITQTMSYFERMKVIYDSKQSSDDENSFLSEESDEDYAKIMKDRIYINHNNLSSDENKSENEVRGRVSQSNISLNYSEFNMNDLDDLDKHEDNPMDSPFYDTFDLSSENEKPLDEEDDDEEPGDPTINNSKKTIIPFIPDDNLEISDELSTVDYNDPSIL